MTEKELRRLRRTELLELLLEETRRAEALAAELEETKAALADRSIRMEHSGTLAEAALRVSGVLEAADEAAKLYLENLRTQDGDPEGLQARMLEETEARCREMLAQTEREAQETKAQTEREVRAYWERIRLRLKDLANSDPALQRALLQAVHKDEPTS